MQFSLATLLAVAGVVTAGGHKNVTYTTEVVTSYTTYCPAPTTFIHKHKTYTVTEATTITLPCDDGCTITKPVYTTSSVICHTCNGTAPTKEPTYTAPKPTTTAATTSAVTAGAAQMAGAGLAGLLGLAAFAL